MAINPHRRGRHRAERTTTLWPSGRTLRRAATGFVAVSLIAGGIATAAPAVADAGPHGHASKASDPGFTGWVLADGKQLGVARLADGTRGICFDAGRHTWPHGVAKATRIDKPKVGYLLSEYMPRARRDATVAAALWAVVGLDLHENSNPRYMRTALREFRREYPHAASRAAHLRNRMLAEADRYAPTAHGYSTRGLAVHAGGTTRSGGVGTVTGIGARSASGHYVPNGTITLTLSGAKFARNGRSRITVHGATTPRSLRWVAKRPGRVRVREVDRGLGNQMFKRQPSIRGSQRVGFSAGTTSTRGTAATVYRVRVWSPRMATQVNDENVAPGASLVDHVRVTGTGGHAVTGAWRLLGPVTPHGTSCTKARWTGAPVAGSGRFTAAGDGTYEVGHTPIDRVGCYTYSERLAATKSRSGGTLTRGTGWARPGESAETSIAVGQPVLHTTVNTQRASAGARVHDNVAVSGTGGAVVAGEWKLLGPVAPNAGGHCRHLRWSTAPTAATGRFTARGDGVVQVGQHTVGTPGCYTYREHLNATNLTRPYGWTPAGVGAETTTVSPTQPRIPTRPQIDTGFTGTRSAAYAPRMSPPQVRIGAVGLRASLMPESFHHSLLTPPADLRQGGYWSQGAGFGSMVGTTVVFGHVSNQHDRPAIFHRLNRAKVGQVVTTTQAGKTTRWRITSVQVRNRHHLPRSLFAQTMVRKLVLVTCTNEVIHRDRTFHYRSNRIVTAVPIR